MEGGIPGPFVSSDKPIEQLGIGRFRNVRYLGTLEILGRTRQTRQQLIITGFGWSCLGRGVEQGDIFNPDLAYIPINETGRGGVFDINRKDFSPRVSAAWQPSFKSGLLNKVFGERRTVIRGGYALTYDRANTVATVIIPMLGVGFAQTLSVLGPKNRMGIPSALESTVIFRCR